MRRCLLRLLVALSTILVAGNAQAHYMGTALLHLKEEMPGRFFMNWKPSMALRATELVAGPTFPRHCTLNASWLDCGQRGLMGAIDFKGLPDHAEVVVHIQWRDGHKQTQVLAAGDDSVKLLGVGQGGVGAQAQFFLSYLTLGGQQMLLGVQHLLFVLGLVLLVGFQRPLVGAVLAFSIAHSITLAAGVLGYVSLPTGFVEAMIALSMVLILAESLDGNPHNLARRWPWVIPLGAGLLHGFGLAEALQQFGFPESQLGLVLLGFNGGVELGQLTAIGLFYFISRGLKRYWPRRFQLTVKTVSYGLGAVAGYWSVQRMVSMAA